MATITPCSWTTAPAEAHRAWRAGLLISERVYADQSQRLYISLFGRFCQWIAGEQLKLVNVSPQDIARFLDTLRGRDGGVAANRTQRTYVAELERVFAHLVTLGLCEANPASKILGMLRITTPLRPRNIKLALPDTRNRYLESLSGLSPSQMTPAEVQDCAMNFLMMDAGLTLKELQKLVLKHVEQVDSDMITAPGHRFLRVRTIKLSANAKEWLLRWLAIRQDFKLISQAQYDALRVAGSPITQGACRARSGRSRVFVSFTGKSGRPLGMRSSGVVLDRLHSHIIYLSAQNVMLAGQDLSPQDRRLVRNKGPQALRNLCSATLVSKGLSTDEVADFLGLTQPDQVWAMQRQMKAT